MAAVLRFHMVNYISHLFIHFSFIENSRVSLTPGDTLLDCSIYRSGTAHNNTSSMIYYFFAVHSLSTAKQQQQSPRRQSRMKLHLSTFFYFLHNFLDRYIYLWFDKSQSSTLFFIFGRLAGRTLQFVGDELLLFRLDFISCGLCFYIFCVFLWEFF